MSINNNLYGVILAGGVGTRFWPFSRRLKPKQFLPIVGKNTFLQETVKRILPKISSKNIYIVTNKEYRSEVVKQLVRFRIPRANILLEPKGKNTAPAILWAAAKIHKLNKDAIVSVFPSDHLITNKGKFLSCLQQAVRLAQSNFLVTFGIKPTRPETGYGYLKTSIKKKGSLKYIKVDHFVEKPTSARAKDFVKKKTYLWNSGMFVWKASVILEAFSRHLPKANNLLKSKTSQVHINKVWNRMPNISIDYGILEKSNNVVAVKAENIGWSDVGSWESLLEALKRDKAGNAVDGQVLMLDCHHSYVRSSGKLIVTIGLSNVIVVNTSDALLVCSSSQSQKVKDVVSLLHQKKIPLT